MHIISRDLYEAALLIGPSGAVYQPGLAAHESALAARLALLNGPRIELTPKGEEVTRLE